MLIFDALYFLLVLILLPLWMKTLLKGDYRRILRSRFSPAIDSSEEKRIWLHAVSVGEVKSLRNLIERLNRSYPGRIVLSVTTPAGYECARDEYRDITVVNAPLDLTFVVKNFIRKINPGLLVLNELEIWPNWILMMKKKRIPMLLVNGRISDTAYKHYHRFSFFFKKFFPLIDEFVLQAECYRDKFTRLGAPADKIQVCGNIKADEAEKTLGTIPARTSVLDYLKAGTNGRKIITLASSHVSDERVVIPVIGKFKHKFSFIIVPRHITRTTEIELQLNQAGIDYKIWSHGGPTDLSREVLVFDRIGYLVNILSVSDVVLMGGTFEEKIGGHNLYEPAILGKPVIGGPFYNNFPDIGKELMEKGVYRQVGDSDELTDILNDLDECCTDDIAALAVEAVKKRKGSTECILDRIQYLIK
jgi:3-deoxy-D-manno-octulosonic-acid transferase